jgi:hypothetical protein
VNGPSNDTGPAGGADHEDRNQDRNEDRIVLDRYIAEDLSHAITLVEDWLLHTGDDVHSDLAHFAFRYDGLTAAVPAFIDALGTCSVQLHRALRATTPAPGQTT